MKKFLLLIVLFGFSFLGFSQDSNEVIASKKIEDTVKIKEKWSAATGIKYGIRGGFTISHLDFEGAIISKNEHRNSMYIGFLANISLTRTLSVVPEIQFSGEGANEETLHLDYIQMPILLRFRFSEKLHAGLGPQIGWNVEKFEDGLTNLGYSAVIGVDYKINYAIFVDLRYNYGIKNVFDNATGFDAKNRNIQIGIGYKF